MKVVPPLKSAYELAVERLAAQDKKDGVTKSEPLSAKQKERIAEARAEARAKLAEIEILHRKDVLAAGGDHEKLADLDRKHQIDRERIESRVEGLVAKIRAGAES